MRRVGSPGHFIYRQNALFARRKRKQAPYFESLPHNKQAPYFESLPHNKQAFFRNKAIQGRFSEQLLPALHAFYGKTERSTIPNWLKN